MKIQRSYKFRVYPSSSQKALLSECFGISRFTYNMALDSIGFAYKSQGQRFSGIDCSRAFTDLSKDEEYIWLKNAPKTVITNSLRNLDKAFKNFFEGRAKYPKFKKKTNSQKATFQLDQRQNNWLPGNMLKLPKLGDIKIKWSRIPSGRPKIATITKTETGKYFVSMSVEEDIVQFEKTGKSCGVDAGVKDLAITEEWKSGAPKLTKQYEQELKIKQRRLSRKTKGSKRWQHARIKVARVHEKIKNSRSDFIHKTSTYIVKSHDYIGIEDLHVKGMLKNRKLSKAIADASMSELHRQLKYKSAWHGRDLRECSRWFPSSKTCSSCGLINKELVLDDRDWECECGAIHDRDKNAAKNILVAAFGGCVEVTGVENGLAGDYSIAV